MTIVHVHHACWCVIIHHSPLLIDLTLTCRCAVGRVHHGHNGAQLVYGRADGGHRRADRGGGRHQRQLGRPHECRFNQWRHVPYRQR
jgi:hypothetical protein